MICSVVDLLPVVILHVEDASFEVSDFLCAVLFVWLRDVKHEGPDLLDEQERGFDEVALKDDLHKVLDIRVLVVGI